MNGSWAISIGLIDENTRQLAASLAALHIFFGEGYRGVQAAHAYAMVEVMMTDLDHMLDVMRAMPADDRLEGMERGVFKGLERRRESSASRRSLALAGVLALGVGWVGSTVPSAPAQASVVPIGMSDYAPSRILGQ